MNTRTISLNIPTDILLALNKNENEFIKDNKVSIAIRFYQLKKLSIGKAAQLCGMSRLDFESLLSENEIPISNLSIDDVTGDVKKLK